MPRSGTTLLQELCHGHLQMYVTNELGNYALLRCSYPSYALQTLYSCHQIGGRWQIDRAARVSQWAEHLQRTPGRRAANHIANLSLVAAHLIRLVRRGFGPVELRDLKNAHPDRRVRVIGDKLPRYIFAMDRLARESELLRVAIYRDARDVAGSFLRMVRSAWAGLRWTRKVDMTWLAHRWVASIEMTEAHAGALLAVRYESLVEEPALQIDRLARYLGVAPEGFDVARVEAASVGRSRQELGASERTELMRIAGPTLERLEYI